MFSKHLANNALLILSRFPIISNDYISFSKYGGYDGIIEKGCNYCKIQVGINTNIHLFNTHLCKLYYINSSCTHVSQQN